MREFYYLLKKELHDKKYITAFQLILLFNLLAVLHRSIFGFNRSITVHNIFDAFINYRTFLLILIPIMYAYSVISDQSGNNNYQTLPLPIPRFIAPLAKLTAFYLLIFVQIMFQAFFFLNLWNKYGPEGMVYSRTKWILFIFFASFVTNITNLAVIGLVCLNANNLKIIRKIVYISVLFVLIFFGISAISMNITALFTAPGVPLDGFYIYTISLIMGIIITGIYLFLYEKHGYIR